MRFATSGDYDLCRRLHRQYGTTYYFASRCFPSSVRRRVDALYGFVRVPDEWVDNPRLPTVETEQRLVAYRQQLVEGVGGIRPDEPVLRAFADTMAEAGMGLEEPLLFLDAMKSDLTVTRYPTYSDLQGYMRGSASAVGAMMCTVLGLEMDADRTRGAHRLGEAMQLTNFLRDVGEDLDRGRVYLPEEDLERFGLRDLASREVSGEFRELMKFEIARARSLYAEADREIDRLPDPFRRPVRLARTLYARILDRIESNGYDVFRKRARTSLAEKLIVAASSASLRSV